MKGFAPSHESVQEIQVEFGTSWLCDGFFLIPSVTCCALIATCKTEIGVLMLQGLRGFYSVMYMLGFLPNWHVILMGGFVPVVPRNFNRQVSTNYVPKHRHGPICGLFQFC